MATGKAPIAHDIELQRGLGLREATMIGVGAMIGAGVFALTGIAAGAAGPALTVAFILNGIVAAITGMSYAELGAAFPQAGGGYSFVRMALPRVAGFVTGWMSWFATAFACALYAQTFGAYFGNLLQEVMGVSTPGLSPLVFARVLAVLAALAFAYINIRGSTETGVAGSIITLCKVLILLAFAGAGLWVMTRDPGWSAQLGLGAVGDFFPLGAAGVFAAMGITYVAFEGYEIIAQGGEEIRDPRRNIPRAIFLSLAIVLPIYLLIAVVCIGAVRPPDDIPSWRYLGSLAEPELAVLEAAKNVLGPVTGMILIMIGGLMSTMSALNATIYSSSRVAFAMSRDALVPLALARVHATCRTPYVAIVVTVVVVVLMAALLPIQAVAAATNILFLLSFTLVNLAAISLRYQRPDADRPFRIIAFPVTTIIAIVVSLGMCVYLVHWEPMGAAVCLGWMVLGLYVFYHHSRRLEHEERGSKVVLEEREVTRRPHQIVVLVSSPESVEPLITVAAALGKATESEILAVRIVLVPRQLPIAEGRQFVNEARPLLDEAVAQGGRLGVPVYTMVRVAQSLPQAVLETLEERHAELVVMGWRAGRRGQRGHVLGSVLDPVILRAPCDVAVLRPGRDGKEFSLDSILVGVTASPHAKLAVEIGQALAQQSGGRVRYLHVVKEGTGMDAKTMHDYLTDAARRRGAPTVEIAHATTTAGGILEFSREADLLVIGAAREPLFEQYFFGDKTQRIARVARCAVLMVKRHPSAPRSILRRLFTPAPEDVDA
ncbi:MAG TPA: amino acid permease [Armatimonadota bacterium]|nr:amino acid permease [Armatimonadota bacterium]